ncbi:unnamed protein product [Chrysoparadoxa australica]
MLNYNAKPFESALVIEEPVFSSGAPECVWVHPASPFSPRDLSDEDVMDQQLFPMSAEDAEELAAVDEMNQTLLWLESLEREAELRSLLDDRLAQQNHAKHIPRGLRRASQMPRKATSGVQGRLSRTKPNIKRTRTLNQPR